MDSTPSSRRTSHAGLYQGMMMVIDDDAMLVSPHGVTPGAPHRKSNFPEFHDHRNHTPDSMVAATARRIPFDDDDLLMLRVDPVSDFFHCDEPEDRGERDELSSPKFSEAAFDALDVNAFASVVSPGKMTSEAPTLRCDDLDLHSVRLLKSGCFRYSDVQSPVRPVAAPAPVGDSVLPFELACETCGNTYLTKEHVAAHDCRGPPRGTHDFSRPSSARPSSVGAQHDRGGDAEEEPQRPQPAEERHQRLTPDEEQDSVITAFLFHCNPAASVSDSITGDHRGHSVFAPLQQRSQDSYHPLLPASSPHSSTSSQPLLHHPQSLPQPQTKPQAQPQLKAQAQAQASPPPRSEFSSFQSFSGLRVDCPHECGRSFVSSERLDAHTRTCARVEPQIFVCKHCMRRFSSAASQRAHENSCLPIFHGSKTPLTARKLKPSQILQTPAKAALPPPAPAAFRSPKKQKICPPLLGNSVAVPPVPEENDDLPIPKTNSSTILTRMRDSFKSNPKDRRETAVSPVRWEEVSPEETSSGYGNFHGRVYDASKYFSSTATITSCGGASGTSSSLESSLELKYEQLKEKIREINHKLRLRAP